MSETSDLLRATAERLFAEHLDKAVHEASEAGEWPAALWAAIEDAGLAAALTPESAGGAGLDAADAFAVLEVAGHARAPVPLAETMIAGHLLGRAGITVPEGALSIASGDIGARRDGDHWVVEGRAARVPWVRHVAAVALLAKSGADTVLVLVPRGGFSCEAGANLAGEPRDGIVVAARVPASSVAPSPVDADGLRLLGAAARTAQIAGAVRFVLDLTVDYVNTRVQFGKPIGRFQAIQHAMAVLAENAAATSAALGLAAAGFGLSPADALVPVAAGKARAGEAAGNAASIAHQSHGAIGFTREYDLHRATRRLWSWRDEFGNEAEWQRALGRAAAKTGADGLWAFLTAAA